MANNILNKKILKVTNQQTEEQIDKLAVEEPLEIQVVYGPIHTRTQKSISITMRTPGNDTDLALGFLYTEGIIRGPENVIESKTNRVRDEKNNKILVELAYDSIPDMDRLERHFYTSSSCGVCGKSSIEALKTIKMPDLIKNQPVFLSKFIFSLPELLRKSQNVFEQTGGLHASAIFDQDGKILMIREDVGRHNALDKIAGAGLQSNVLPYKDNILLVSGRASFELVQKAAMIGVPVMAAVGAPSSLAVELAEEVGITLIGF